LYHIFDPDAADLVLHLVQRGWSDTSGDTSDTSSDTSSSEGEEGGTRTRSRTKHGRHRGVTGTGDGPPHRVPLPGVQDLSWEWLLLLFGAAWHMLMLSQHRDYESAADRCVLGGGGGGGGRRLRGGASRWQEFFFGGGGGG
jgi:hypothetical protein